eukprot:scaffold10611_cov107-Isochrysis_galbana.AAC.2
MLAVLAFSPGVLAPPGLVLPASNKVLRAPVPVGQMNSDSRPTEEYFDFLLGEHAPARAHSQPSAAAPAAPASCPDRPPPLFAQAGTRRTLPSTSRPSSSAAAGSARSWPSSATGAASTISSFAGATRSRPITRVPSTSARATTT